MTSASNGENSFRVQRRRRWTPEEKVRIVEETHLPGERVAGSPAACRNSVLSIFTWRRLVAQGVDCRRCRRGGGARL